MELNSLTIRNCFKVWKWKPKNWWFSPKKIVVDFEKKVIPVNICLISPSIVLMSQNIWSKQDHKKRRMQTILIKTIKNYKKISLSFNLNFWIAESRSKIKWMQNWKKGFVLCYHYLSVRLPGHHFCLSFLSERLIGKTTEEMLCGD